MQYPIVIHKDRDSDYGVTVPDLPGCFSGGTTIDEAIARAREAIEVYLEFMIEQGRPIPPPRPIEQHRRNPDYRGGTWALASIHSANLRVKAKRVNITIPERVLDVVDRVAVREGDTRSGLLTRAVTKYIDELDDAASPKATPRAGRHPTSRKSGFRR
ncbi:MAG TPA: type II toxin-antitoxin system HicB family antitoxin [Phycisphaerae bacterium]|jgi:predicted RNase H-like HicB family nuclease